MINKLLEYSKRPEVYAPSSAKFWDDEHISKEMLKAHLHPTLEAASRSHDFVDKSVEWIQTIASPKFYKNVLDLGCGPGLYSQRLSFSGYLITGIDFSQRSIEYAKEQAKLQGSNVTYNYMNYLEMDYSDEFQLVLLIYCDFGVLSHNERGTLLQKIYSAMKVGGKFIFDVFTPKHYEGKQEGNHWYLNQGSGFWKPETHFCLQTHYIYEDNIRLDQYVIIDCQNKIDVFRVWDRYYTEKMIAVELERVGFKNIQIYSDLTGKAYDEESKTMGIVVEK